MFDPSKMRIEPLGERAYMIRGLGGAPAWEIAKALRGGSGIEDATSAYDTVAVYVESSVSMEELRRSLADVELVSAPEVRSHTIPVCYELGLDLDDAATALKLSTVELIEAHTSAVYRCYAIGFTPGFPFLGYLAESLQGLSRRPSPRPRVPAGSVGITGRQTGVYPSETPGGWHLIGRTPLCLAAPEDGYFPIEAGDEVRFVAIDESEFQDRRGARL